MRHAALTNDRIDAVAGFHGPCRLGSNPNDKAGLAVQEAILAIKEAYPGMADWFNNSAGYAVFPKVGKGGFIIGGAYGKGLVIAGD